MLYVTTLYNNTIILTHIIKKVKPSYYLHITHVISIFKLSLSLEVSLKKSHKVFSYVVVFAKKNLKNNVLYLVFRVNIKAEFIIL